MPRHKVGKSTFGSVEKRGDNKYRIKWTDKDGERRSETIVGPKFVADERLAELRLGLLPASGAMTYRRYWEETVLPSLDSLAETTKASYIKDWDLRLEPHIADESLESTDWRRVQEVVDAQPSQSGQRKALVLMKKIRNMAVRDRLIKSNDATTGIRLRQRTRRPKGMVYADEIPEWMEAISGRTWEPVLLLEIGGGLRVEEASAITWEDVSPWEFRGKTYALVNVDEAIVMVDNRPHSKPIPKNDSSRREVVVGEPFASRLLCLSKGSGPIAESRVGGHMSPAVITHEYKNFCDRTGLKYVSQKDLRTVYSTNMGEAGANASVVSKAMGHAGSTTRERNYMVSTKRGLARIADMYEDLIIEASEDQ